MYTTAPEYYISQAYLALVKLLYGSIEMLISFYTKTFLLFENSYLKQSRPHVMTSVVCTLLDSPRTSGSAKY